MPRLPTRRSSRTSIRRPPAPCPRVSVRDSTPAEEAADRLLFLVEDLPECELLPLQDLVHDQIEAMGKDEKALSADDRRRLADLRDAANLLDELSWHLPRLREALDEARYQEALSRIGSSCIRRST